MSGIILEHVGHVVTLDERIVDSNNLDLFWVVQASTEDKTTDATETVDT
eukprot:CAMPEP_0202504624 /NCGR_PEP_ID=MMETSP1361-20130828/45083_1 /ASSEMBLY_ACC=CAM_ASM_000849 /TAXON_ID=210615 /ORGANISM="Staurosira complex sp., Strain CCMP2646" /LENGTH=48 /DNA_ID= /DNA_START= /DNA_END= /DNA_ORIENTATION=